MRLKATVTTDHPIVFIYDPTSYALPPPRLGKDGIFAGPATIAVTTQVPIDGETTFEMGTSLAGTSGAPAFEGELQTPGRKIGVSGSDGVPILSMSVCEAITPVKIWTNAPNSPDHVQILVCADFSNVLPYAAPTKGEEMDRAVAKQLAEIAGALNRLATEIETLTANVKDSYQSSRIKQIALASRLASNDLFEEVATQSQDLRANESSR